MQTVLLSKQEKHNNGGKIFSVAQSIYSNKFLIQSDFPFFTSLAKRIKKFNIQLESLVHYPSQMKLKIRQEQPSDYAQTKKVVQLAFDKKAE
jgi:hypothetical protein